ncbi:MAG: hypothetical protein ACE362_05010 [Phaeodactylibacter xiamenensis]|uniref:hypothetical protein n=1 Tax=Phaeodactylibacter xiamenensis TaxID=1524460 RepID=UPI000696E1D1
MQDNPIYAGLVATMDEAVGKVLTGLVMKHPEIAERLHKELFDYLNSVGALFPRKDPLYDAQNEQAYLQSIENELLPRLEEERLQILSPDFDGGNWWGSQVVED